MPALNSLVTQPNNAQPPDVQGTSGTDQASGLQGLVRGGPMAQGPAMQGPSHQETTALLQHMSFFQHRLKAIASDPEIGQKNIRPEIHELMADALADDYASLPEVMGALKQLPTNPLEQKQWVDHYMQQNDKAMLMLLQHYAVFGQPPEQGPAPKDMDRAALVKGSMSRIKAHPKVPPKSSKGIPVRG